MPRWLVMSVAATALCASLAIAQDAPESLLPPGFDDPAPPPTPTPTARPQATQPGSPAPGSGTVVPTVLPPMPAAAIGRAPGGDRECQYVYISVVAGSFNKKTHLPHTTTPNP